MQDTSTSESAPIWLVDEVADVDYVVSQPGVTHHFAKRTVDIMVSSVMLLLSCPLILAIAVYIRWHSKGPVIFRQTRIKQNRRQSQSPASYYYVHPNTDKPIADRRGEKRSGHLQGADRRVRRASRKYVDPRSGELVDDRRKNNLHGQPFTFYKFATMYPDAKQRFPELYAYDYCPREIQHIRFKTQGDPRVPKWAAWLRSSSLDELPNLVNSLKGDMSLVGPRPDIPEMVRYYTPQQRTKLSVKPGVTGFAQIRGRGELSLQDTLKHDLKYVSKWSIWLDVSLLFETFVKLFTGSEGAY